MEGDGIIKGKKLRSPKKNYGKHYNVRVEGKGEIHEIHQS